MTAVELLLGEISSEFPNFRIVPKSESRVMKAIDRFLRVVTLGRQSRFLTEYHTILGTTLFVAPTWQTMDAKERAVLLRHERVHMRQSKRLGPVGMALLYLLPFFPLGLAYGRARLEWEAYRETLTATMELWGIDAARNATLRSKIISRFTGPDYGWMWPFRPAVEAWYDRHIAQLCQSEADLGSGSKGRHDVS
jgi:hypothetical protein